MLDTNVVFSMFLFPSGHFNRLKKLLAKQQIVLCSYVVDEIKEVVARKFPDLPILVTAILEDVDVLISGDKDFTALASEIEKPEILTPTEFIEIYG